MEGKVVISRDGQTIGEFTQEEIAEFFVTGELNPGTLLPTDHYWMNGMPDWRPLGELGEKLDIPKTSEIQEPKKVKRWKVPAALVLGGGIVAALVFILMQEKGEKGIPVVKGGQDSLDKSEEKIAVSKGKNAIAEVEKPNVEKEQASNEGGVGKGEESVVSKAKDTIAQADNPPVKEEPSKNEGSLDKGVDRPVATKEETKITKKEDKAKIAPLIIKPIIDPLIPKP
jgi:hypothetical protein